MSFKADILYVYFNIMSILGFIAAKKGQHINYMHARRAKKERKSFVGALTMAMISHSAHNFKSICFFGVGIQICGNSVVSKSEIENTIEESYCILR